MTTLAITRLARRTARGGGWRHLLVVTLIALSVAAATSVAIAARSLEPDVEAELAATMGAADARLTVSVDRSLDPDAVPTEHRLLAAQQVAGLEDAPAQTLDEVTADVDALLATIRGADVTRTDRAWLSLASGHLEVHAADVTDPLLAGRYRYDGPPATGSVLVSRAAREQLGVGIGDELALPGIATARVSGGVEDPLHLGRPLVVFPPGVEVAPRTSFREREWLVGVTTDAQRQALADATAPYAGSPDCPDCSLAAPVDTECPPTCLPGLSVERRDVVRDRLSAARPLSQEPTFVGTVVGIVLLVQVALVSAAAFATGARRRIRELGLLGAAGATPRQLRALVTREALVLGSIGGTAGAVLGVVAAALGRPVIERMMQRPITELSIAPLDVLTPALLGATAALAAAFLPARTVARVPTSTALAGRIPLGRVPRWVAPVAGATVVLGLAVLLQAVARRWQTGISDLGITAGVVLTLLGASALAVPVVGLGGRLADRLPVLGRLVLRDAARQRTRSAATVAALVTTLTLPVILLSTLATDNGWDRSLGTVREDVVSVVGPVFRIDTLPPTTAAVDEAVATLPQTERRVDVATFAPRPDGDVAALSLVSDLPTSVPSRNWYEPGARGRTVAVATPDLLALYGVDLQEVPARTTYVAAQPRLGMQGNLPTEAGPGMLQTLGHTDQDDVVQEEVLQGFGVRVEPLPARLVTDLPLLLVSPDLVAELDLVEVGGVTLLDLVRDLSRSEARSLAQAERLDPDGYPYRVTPSVTDPWSTRPLSATSALVGASLLVALFISGMTAALAATESDRDLSLLVAIGGEPRLRRRFHGLQALYHAGAAAVIALPTGVLLAVAMAEPGRLVLPWGPIVAVLVAVPALTGVAHRLLSRSAPVTAPLRLT